MDIYYIWWSEFLNSYGELSMSRDSDLRLYVELRNVNQFINNITFVELSNFIKFINNIKSLLRDILSSP